MKKILSLLMILMLASSTAMAAEKKSSKSKKKETAKKEEKKAEKKSSSNSGSEKGGFVLQFQGGLSCLVSSSMGATFNAGIGGEISGAYAFNKHFSIGLMTGLEAVAINTGDPSATEEWSYTPTEFVFQYNFGGSTSPFLSLGLGIANSQITVHETGTPLSLLGISESDFIFSPGAGVAFEVNDKINVFIQTRLDILTPSADWTDEFGSELSPGVFLPIQVGLNFSSL